MISHVLRRGFSRDQWWMIGPAAAIPLILFLSVADAFLTLFLLARGASEVNPFMSFFIEMGFVPFLTVKLFLTGGGLLFVFLHQDASLFRTRVPVKALFSFFLVPYFLVVHWEVYLILFEL